jgi:hypothetical protein
MALHTRTHPEPVDGCFGCKAIGVGVQALQIRHGADPTRRVPVVREVGPTRGTVGGYHIRALGRPAGRDRPARRDRHQGQGHRDRMRGHT